MNDMHLKKVSDSDEIRITVGAPFSSISNKAQPKMTEISKTCSTSFEVGFKNKSKRLSLCNTEFSPCRSVAHLFKLHEGQFGA